MDVSYDPEAVHAKYLEERDKRLIPGRAAIRDLTGENLFAKYREDPFTPFEHREPLFEEIDVAVVGAVRAVHRTEHTKGPLRVGERTTNLQYLATLRE